MATANIPGTEYTHYGNQSAGRRTLLHYISDLAIRDPHKPAIHQLLAPPNDQSEGQQVILSYRDIAALVDKICWSIHGHGVEINDSSVIAYLGPSDLRDLLISLAATKLGTKALLISPRSSPAICKHLLGNCDSTLLLFDCSFDGIKDEISQTMKIDTLMIDDLLDLIQDLDAVENYPFEGSWDTLISSPMLVLHTSGSTGMPKPVSMSHHAVAAADSSRFLSKNEPCGMKCHFEIMAEARTVYVAFPLFHAAGFGMACYFLFSGSTVLFGYPHQPPNTSVLRDALQVPDLDGALLPPSLIDDIAKDAEILDGISKLDWIFSGGGSISLKSGDTVLTKCRLFNAIGSTECWSFVQYPTDPSNWHYYHFHPCNGIYWRPVLTGSNEEPTDFELVIRRDMSYEQYQAVFHNFPDVEEWSTKDVFRKHPSIDELWEYRYRIDDLVVFSTGEKMNPMPVESRLNGIPGVKAALVFGGNRLYPGLLVEMDDGTQIGISLDTVPDDLQRSIKDALKIENSQNSRDSEIHEKMIIFAPTDKPFVRTPKGTVHRNQTLQLYESDIDKIYHSVDISESSDWEPLCLDLSDEKALAASLATFIGKSLLSSTALMAHMDVFAAGLDSKKAQILAISLERALGDRGCRASEDKLTININAIYQNPTPAMLASFIFRDLESLEDGPGEENGFDQILTRYLEDIPTTPMSTKAAASNSNGRHVLLTGSTGFVGSYTLYALLQRKEIKRVTCLNRSGGDQTNAWIQQFPNYEPTVKFKHLQADLTQPDFGLSADVYSELLDSVTDILHCQWAVDFNRPLDYFEPNIKGVSSLIHFTHAAKHAIHFIFLSSVGTVRNWDQPNAVPEERLTSPSIAGTGYGASKLIASLLLDKVGQSVGIRSSICRLGQVAGPIQYLQKRKHSQHQKPELDHTRAWPLRDWFPTLLTSSIDIGCLPDTLGFANEIDWLPVDFVGEILSDLVCNLDLDASRCVDHSGHGHAGTDGFLTKYYHLVNPHRTQYSDMVQFLAGRLGRPDALKVVSLQEWVSLLTDLALGSSGIRSQSSGIGLLGFFQGLADSSYLNPLILDTRKTEQQLPRLVSLGSVSEHWLDMWLEQWGLMKTRGGKQMLED